MRTAVQIRPRTRDGDLPRTEILCGSPCANATGSLGPVVFFGSGEIVAYLLRRRRRLRLFVFRTLEVDDRLAATVPGVSPRVRLLLELHTPLRIRRARALFAHLARTRRDPSALTDAFYVRVGVALAGRLAQPKVLRSFLSPPRAPSDLWTSASRANGVSDGPGVVKPNYWSPKDHAQRWSGRGAQPQWFKDHLAAGGTEEDVRIPEGAL
jgi:H-NS histone family